MLLIDLWNDNHGRDRIVWEFNFKKNAVSSSTQRPGTDLKDERIDRETREKVSSVCSKWLIGTQWVIKTIETDEQQKEKKEHDMFEIILSEEDIARRAGDHRVLMWNGANYDREVWNAGLQLFEKGKRNIRDGRQ